MRTALHMPPNMVGMDANLALLGLCLAMLGLFNVVFFPLYYGNTAKVGSAFAWSSVAMFAYMLVAEALTHVAPFLRDCIDTPDPQFLPQKAIFLAAGIGVYVGLTVFSYLFSKKTFEACDQ